MRPIIPQTGHTVEEAEEILASGQFVFADCYTIIPKTGAPLRYTSAQQNVDVVPLDGVTPVRYYAGKVLLTGLLVRNTLGIEVDQQEVTLDYTDAIDYQAQLTWPQALLAGRLDGARIRRDRFIAQNWRSPWLGGMPMFKGLVSSLNKVGRQSATVSVKAELVLLDTQMPRDLFEPQCGWTWGDSSCGIDQNSFSELATIGENPTRSVLPWSGATDEFSLGKIFMSNGDDTVRVRTISRVADGKLFLAYPLDFDPVEGGLFTAFPNCKRMKDNCVLYHGDPGWKSKFKGFPFIPVAETAVGGVGGSGGG